VLNYQQKIALRESSARLVTVVVRLTFSNKG